ncbi:MAG: hypothetical protein QOH72_3196 [Solirubrobacteraceae bacterium]|jgi:hypothetical protein|nr:hypothetical protein [Solirubrobacteraceae bacterium]
MTPERRESDRFRRPAPSRGPGRSDEPRAGFLRRWPPVLWLLVYVGSIFILNGSNGQWDPLELALGIGLAAIACALAIYLAIGPWPGRPRPRGTRPLIAGVAAFYAICALAAAIFAGPAEAIATLLAGIIPMTGAALWIATARAKTRPGPRERDPAAADEDDPFAGVGADDSRPLGDTPEAHDEISPHDLPAGHPGRHAAERQAHELGGATPGHRDGGATDPSSAESDLVGAEEREGARGKQRTERGDA